MGWLAFGFFAWFAAGLLVGMLFGWRMHEAGEWDEWESIDAHVRQMQELMPSRIAEDARQRVN